ncbi:MipA/OmpV family protein [Aestuariivirga litoralis]|uniref:MipA/OmpV family protein n=1 Tax=Aestuariivirga litoralis TaxID=2650924 RepID=A0A2W2ARZ1_9HYPH|nr:MipA/OmpV family protein [Aestuariivirga litoralis]PZF76402.1 MipA/OmpV family protein [Aestuariivirga litoralis]
MTLPRLPLFVAALSLLALSAPASAEDVSGHQYVMDLGAGVMAQPRYPGSDETIFVPYPLIAVSKFFVPGYGQIDAENDTRNFAIYPSFNYIGKRNSADSNELKGLKDVDWALEAGIGLSARYDWIRGFVEVRQGFNGYSGQVAQFGLDVIASPTEDLEVRFGPRAGWGSQSYMDTYFGINASEAAASPLYDQAYHADAGFNTVGLAGSATYNLTDDWKLHALVGWDRLVGDAGNSPIVEEGSVNQYYAGTGLTYRFAFDLF